MIRTIYTIGHSNRPLEEFIALLNMHGIALVADIRTVPKSRHNPQFNADLLERSLAEADIGYRRFEGLGGFRHAKKDSKNLGWRNASFRGYADYMGTPAFAEALASLEEAARQEPIALMCAEAVPWRCHRSLVGDALTVRGWEVLDITGPGKAAPHRQTPFLRVNGDTLSYPPLDGAQPLL